VNSGTSALHLALLAAGIGPGDEVITIPFTFVATVSAIGYTGATAVFVDIDPLSFTMDPTKLEAAITPRTKAIVPVHLYGQMAEMDAILAIANRHGIPVIEDACQAHGASRAGVRAGTMGLAAAFSFYPGKNLGAMGDAGAVVSDDAELVARVRALREHGQREKYRHVVEGYTARLDTIQAIVLLRKLQHLDGWNEQRRAVAASYTQGLAGVGDLTLPFSADDSDPVWHLYVVRTESPAALADHLAARGIGTGRHYPEPIHLSEAYRGLGYARGDFPVTERIAATVLSLPIFPGMTGEEVETVVSGVKEYFNR
jgi:dTDP-4-amino-4,6-dideoxygalactose transaminase